MIVHTCKRANAIATASGAGELLIHSMASCPLSLVVHQFLLDLAQMASFASSTSKLKPGSSMKDMHKQAVFTRWKFTGIHGGISRRYIHTASVFLKFLKKLSRN